jgi:hypothetical protein
LVFFFFIKRNTPITLIAPIAPVDDVRESAPNRRSHGHGHRPLGPVHEIPGRRSQPAQRSAHTGGMDPETSGVGAPREPGLRVGRHQRRTGRRGRGGNRRDRQACARRQRCHTEDESAQV